MNAPVKPFNWNEILKTLGISIALWTVFVSAISLLGFDLNQAIDVASTMVGAQFLFSLVINILKIVGVVKDHWAPYISAALNVLLVAAVAVVLGYELPIDLESLDLQFHDIATALSLLLGIVLQLVGTRQDHLFYTRGLRISQFSFGKA